jgi:hypothetical protein
MTTTNTDTNTNTEVERIFKTKEGYNECDHCQSVLSPAAYFVKLVETIEKYIPTHKLKTRRPDLFELPLNCDSTNKTKLYLEIVNEIMKENLDSKLKLGIYALRELARTNVKVKTYLEVNQMNYDGLRKDLSLSRELGISNEDCQLIISKDALQELASAKYPSVDAYHKKHNISYDDLYKKLKLVKELGVSQKDYRLITSGVLKELAKIKYPLNLPANFPLISIRAYLEKQGVSLADVYKVLKPDADNVAESLGLSPEEYKTITDPTITDSHLKEVYGIDKSELKGVEKFIAQTNIDYDKLEQLLDCYNEVKKTSIPKAPKLAIDSANKTIKSDNKTIDDDAQALGFLHRFIRLANKLSWSFDELSDVLIAIDKNEINTASLKQISRIKSLQEEFKKPLAEVCKLYPNASISIEESKSEEDANNAAESLFFLQGVKESHLKKEYGIDEPSEPFKEQSIDEFIAQDGLNREKVERLLNNYTNNQSTTHSKKAKKPLNTEIRSTINVKEQRFLHNFTQLTEKLKLLFGKLDGLIKALPDEFKLKDLVTNVDNSIVLQKIWNISDNELTSLINYNDNTSYENGKSRFLGAHKQVLLARLMDISIAEIIQILLQLNINDLNLDNVERIIVLNDWLSTNSITIEQLNILVNSSVLSHQHMEQISEIQKELEQNKELAQDKQYFYDTIHKHVSVNPDVLAAAHQFTKKHATDLQLLRLESLNKSIHNVGIIANKAVFLGEDKTNTNNNNLVEHSISEPRENVAVATIDTKTIFFGGKKSENNEYSRKIDIYDDKTGEWATESASEARDSAASAVVGNKAIFLGGNKGNRECSSQIDVYDYETQQWTHLPNKASEARSNASVAEIGQKAIFFGGRINKTTSNAVDIYDSGIWTTHTASKARVYASVAVVDTKVIFLGGSKNSKECSLQIDIYDSTTNNWTTHTASEARRNASVAIVDGKAIFFGGKADQTRSNKIDIYDAKTEKWTQHITSEARDTASVAVVGGQAVFFGGNKNNEQFSSQVDIYDSITNNWTTHTVSEAHKNVSVAVIGAKAIFFVGKKDSRVTGKVDIYDSTSKSWVTHVAQDNELHDGLLANITNSTKYCGKIDIYDNTAKNWKVVDIYKPNKCTSISIRNNKAILTFKDSTHEQIYSINLSITYDATTEELLNNVAVFTTLKMDAEDINNITNYEDIYNLKATWTEKQIRTLTDCKTLQDAFSGNELTLSQYTEWLCDSYDESKVTGKIAQLTNWDHKILDDMKKVDTFGQCFSNANHPIDSLVKIKSFMDIADQSGINGEVLLELKDLHNSPAATEWTKYDSAEKKLKSLLSSVEGVKEHLEDQKRNILANYMLHTYSEIKNKNMRGLYAFLLIDVEMSDCSKISPLKAGLNSLQLYIHRCILGLENEATVNQNPETGLSEEMWDLLDNYREWEATKKSALYPENYLNPTLRKSATAEYKALQNTLMQGSLTDEEAANVYIKYFEDFAQLVNLQIVDTYFVDNKLYILGRTLAEPYIYYYRIGDFKSDKDKSPQKWGPWQKIEAQIPVKIARIIHVFSRIFVFWLQKTEKEKQIDDISINDSTLNVNYIFKKVDGSWSAQQKLPCDIKIDSTLEHTIRGLLVDKKLYNKQIEHINNVKNDNKGGYYVKWKKSNKVESVSRKEAYSEEYKDSEWATQEEYEEYCNEIIKDFKEQVKKCEKSIKDTVKKLKDINEKFDGKLKVAVQNSEILVLSCENGFKNNKFILKEDLTSKMSYTRYFESISDIAEATKSITAFYTGKKDEEKNIVTRQIREIQRKIDKKKTSVNNEQSELDNLKTKKDGKIGSKDTLQSRISSVGQSIAERRKLWQNVENLKVKLARLFPQKPNDLQNGSIERGNLQTAINNLKQELTQYKRKAESTNAELQQKLITLEAEVATLIDDIAKLATEETVDDSLQEKINDIIKRLGDLQLQEAQLNPLEESAEKRKLQATADNLKQKLAQLKQSTESKKVELLKQLTELGTEVTNLESEINQLPEPEKTIEALKKEKGILEENIKQHEKEIKKLEDGRKKHEKEKKYLEDEISKLQKEKKEIEDDNDEVSAQRRHNQLDDKRQKEIDLITKLISQKDHDNVDQSVYEDKKVCQLINVSYKSAYIKGSGAILAPEVQQQTLDFEGFYGVYLWEIFFHIPTLVAYLFNQEQKFSEARKWYQYIFNPLKKGCDAWQFIPFKTKCPPSNVNDQCDSGELVDSIDSYKEAYKKKASFEKYVIISYVDNLIDWGDVEFSKESWEGINQATMLYIRAWDLLGEKPKKKGKHKSDHKNICEVLTANREMLCKVETGAPSSGSHNAPNPASSNTIEYCSYFCTTENKKFTELWDRVEDRLYKIRHCLDIRGKRLELPLFQPPIDPRQLISAAGGGSTIRLPKISQVPHYRFKHMITYAKSIADTVTQIGSELLSVLEKKDAEALTMLYNKQEGIMANLMTTIKEKAIEALKEEAKALNASLGSAKSRKSRYEQLIEKGWSALEISSMALSVRSTVLTTIAGLARQAGAVAHAIPTIFGFSNGGFQPGSLADSIARAMEIQASIERDISQNLSTSASYERRAQDWDLQKIMATHDTEQISHQIEANKINQANALQDLKAHRESIKQIREKEEFFRSKFTNQELYSWMKGELKSLYIRVYRLALEIAKQAEWTYQYEIDNNKTFIQPGYWNSLKEGLLSGQKLKFDLEQLDKEYHDTNERRLEIAKVISLKHLNPIALYELKTKGSCKFSFTEKLFDLDFPGHYARKIKDIKITIPAVVGPYENIHASLQQTSNKVVLKSDGAINAIKYLVNPNGEEQPENDLLRVNWKPNQEIAISKGDQDSGLFELSFGDERYLPFEGTGAVSTWELSLPQATNRFDISTISDVIIHLDYTALNGGDALSSHVKNLNQLKYYHGTLVANLSAIYPAEWDKFKQQAKGSSSELKFRLSSEIFPVHVKNPSIDLDGENNICIIPTTPDVSKMTIKVNNYSWERNTKKIVNPVLTIGSDWSIKINNTDISKVEEMMIVVPYKATINW